MKSLDIGSCETSETSDEKVEQVVIKKERNLSLRNLRIRRKT